MSLKPNDLFAVSRGGKLFSVNSSALKSAYSSDPVVSVGPNPPSNPVQGTLWWSTREGNLFIWYNDGDSLQWVDASPAFVEIDYGRIEDYLDQAVLATAVSKITPGTGILVSPSSGKGNVTVAADPTPLEDLRAEFEADQKRQDDLIASLEATIKDMADRLEQIENELDNIDVVDGGYPNAIADFDEPDTDGGQPNAEGVFDQPVTNGGNAATL